MAPQSIFLRDYRVMAPAQLVHYPHGVSTLLPIIEACDNTSLPVGPFSATWKTLRDEHNSKYKKAPDSLTPLDQLVPFFIAAPEASPEQYTQPQPIGFVRPDVLQAMRDYSTEQASQPIFNFLGGIEAPWGVSFADWLNAPRGPVTPFELRTQEMTRMVESWREKDMFPENLRGQPVLSTARCSVADYMHDSRLEKRALLCLWSSWQGLLSRLQHLVLP